MRILYLFPLSFLLNLGYSQQGLLFETKIHFEDAIGNRDSVVVGYDSSANRHFNPHLGEVRLVGPFDEHFEVRGARVFAWNGSFSPSDSLVLSKHIYGGVEKLYIIPDPGYTCYISEPIVFFIKAKHFPVRILWDSTVFKGRESCVSGSFLTPDFGYHIVDPIEAWMEIPGKRFGCMEDEGRFEINLDLAYSSTAFPNEIRYFIKRPDSKGQMETIYGVALELNFSETWSPCDYVIQTENDHSRESGQSLILFPNPGSDQIQLKTTDGTSVKASRVIIRNIAGQELLRKTNKQESQEGIQLDVRGLPPGYYWVECSDLNGSRMVLPWVKE
ncbi:MAG TPA: T9SS type A sorting domain-containing protein [Saprospiraceae bacterium]|nr:T9SS type A sorting domain-containing protein [Saprospiraceae bacterium]